MKLSKFFAATFLVVVLSVPMIANAAPVCWSGNGHCYEAVSIPSSISWGSAKSDAELSSYLSQSGYLATLTSQEENDFVWANFGGSLLRDYWLGGFQTSGSTEPDGGWEWVTGELWSFTNWNTGEPNNLAGGQEDKLEFAGGTSTGALSGKWNDELVTGHGVANGYIIEYPTAVPIPPALYLFGSGLLGLIGFNNFARVRKTIL